MAKRIRLKDLLDAGLLQVGEELVCEPRHGERYTATVLQSGTITYEGHKFDSPSGWSDYVANNSTNGWELVRVRGLPLKHFRSQLTNDAANSEDTGGTPVAVVRFEETKQPETEEPARDIQQQLLSKLQSLSSSQFEHLVGAFLEAKGLSEVRVTGRAGDDGIDGEGKLPFLKLEVAFQAKRYATGNTVGIEPVQRLRGSMASGFDRGIFITTSNFSPAARGWVEETGASITLINGTELVNEMIQLGLGVKTIPVIDTQTDEDFFETLGT